MIIAKDILFRGLHLTVSINGKPYQGIVVKYATGDNILIKLGRADMMLLQVVLNTEIMIRCIADDGHAYGFKSRLKGKKIPLITVSYPEGELQGINVRKMERVPVSFWAELKPVIAPPPVEGGKMEILGDANITDMGVGGCKVISQQALKKGNPVFLEFSYGENDEPVRFKVQVRSSRSAPYDSTYYGLQFLDLNDREVNVIKKILEDPQKA